MRNFVVWALGATVAAYFWSHNIALALMVGCVTMALARD